MYILKSELEHESSQGAVGSVSPARLRNLLRRRRASCGKREIPRSGSLQALVIALRTDLVAASSGQESWEGGRDAGVGAEYGLQPASTGKPPQPKLDIATRKLWRKRRDRQRERLQKQSGRYITQQFIRCLTLALRILTYKVVHRGTATVQRTNPNPAWNTHSHWFRAHALLARTVERNEVIFLPAFAAVERCRRPMP